MAKQYTLGKDERLKSRKAIEELFKGGKSFSLAPFRIYYREQPLTDRKNVLKFGVGVSTKNFKKAVDRNRVKRLTREAYRLQKILLQETLKEKRQSLNIFFIYTGREIPVYEEVSTKVNSILKKLLKLVNENSTTNT